MTIFFLGTSNCIIGHSFVKVISGLTTEGVVNASLGSCPCTVGLYLMPELAMEPDDIVFLDYTITDEASLASGLRCEDEIREIIASLAYRIDAAGALPILIINPTTRALLNKPPIEDLHVRICDDLSIPVFSTAKLLRLALSSGCTENDLMIDAAHHSELVTTVVGPTMLAAIADVRAKRATLRMVNEPIWDVRRIAASPLVPMERHVTRSTRLRSATMARVRTGEDIVFDVAPDEAVLGFLVNAGAPGANVKIVGDGEIVTSFRTQYDNRNPEAFLLVFLETKTRLRGNAFGLRLELVSLDAELSEYTLAQRSIDLDVYGEIQIDGIIVGKKMSATKLMKTDLLEKHYPRLCRELTANRGRF